jgi:serine/threonine protein kinase
MDQEATVSEGTYGKITKINRGGSIFALKQFKKDEREALSRGIISVREFDITHRCVDCDFLINVDGIVAIENPDPTVDEYGMYMDYYDWDLYSYLKNIRKATVDNLVSKKTIMIQCLLGLEYLDKIGVFHNDIKPENILVRENDDGYPTIQLCDFGLATFWPTLSVCTVTYRSPEICANVEEFDRRSDVWSMGCVFYEMIAGKPFISYSKLCSMSEKTDDFFEDTWVLSEMVRQLNIQTKTEISKVFPRLSRIRPSRRIRSAFTNMIKPNFFESACGSWESFIKLLRGMLAFNPKERLTATEALNSDFFADEREVIDALRSNVAKQEKKIVSFKDIPESVRKIAENLNVINKEDVRIGEMTILQYSKFVSLDDPDKIEIHFFQTLYLFNKFFSIMELIEGWEDFIGNEELASQWDPDFEIKFLKHLEFKLYTDDVLVDWVPCNNEK